MTEKAPPSDTAPPPPEADMPPDGNWRIMHDTDPATIQQQIEAGLLRPGFPGGAQSFLNNFPDNMPGGRRRDEQLATKYSNMFGPNAMHSESTKWDAWEHSAHSELMKTTRNEQFHKDIETAMQEATKAGLFDRAEFDRLTIERRAGRLQGPALEAYFLSTVPVYALLREARYGESQQESYSHYDLWQ